MSSYIQKAFITTSLLFSSSSIMAAGGLEEATSAVQEIQVWLYGFLGAAAIVYMIYQVLLAMLDKQPWGDVVIAVGKVAAAGACVAVAIWAWGIWGS